MDKGIRPAARAKFLELLPQRTELGNTGFRKSVMAYLCEEFGISIASAATAYNEAFKHTKGTNPELVEGLGRPEDKKGGRKPKSRVPAEAAAFVDAETVAQTVFTVKKKSNGEVVAEGLSLEAAKEMVERAVSQKKAKLYWV